MNGHEDFERELRGTLDELGSEPAPNRLLARVRAIPTTEPRPLPLGARLAASFGGLGTLAAATAVGLIVAGALFVRFSGQPAAVGSPSAPGSIAPTALPTSSSSAQPSPGPTATPQPTGATPAPSTQRPTTAPTGTPAPTATAVPSGPFVVGQRVPPGFEPVSITFVSPTEGFAVGWAPCGGGQCTLVVHTANAGRSWTVRSKPAIALATRGIPSANPDGVTTIRFADPKHGWLYGPALYVTSDGGTTWTRTAISGFDATVAVLGLEASRGFVQAVAEAQNGFVIATSAVGSNDWSLAPVSLQPGAGPVPQLQLVLSANAGWVLQNDRVVTDGARLAGGQWASWQPPCAGALGPGFVAASSASEVVAVCDVGQWATPGGTHLFASHDGGASFAETGMALPIASTASVATPGASTIVVAGSTAQATGEIVGSFDGGATWTVLVADARAVTDLGFTTAKQGVAVVTRADGSTGLLMTRDGGHTWTAVAF